MASVQVTTDPDMTVAVAGQALLDQLEAKGRAKSHTETVESHLCVHLKPFFKDKSLDRITDGDVTRLLVRLRRSGLKPKTMRNILSTLHSLFEIALRRGWVDGNPCKLVDAPVVQPSGDIRFLTQAELTAVVDRGVPDDDWGVIERPLYLMAAMTGLRQGELLGLRWLDLDSSARKVRVRQTFVRGEFKAPKSRRGTARAVCRWRRSWSERSPSSRCGRPSSPTTTWCSPTPKPASRCIAPRSASASRRHAGAPTCASFGSTTFGTLWNPDRRFGRGVAAHAAGVGHRDAKTTLIYADHQPGEHESEIVSRAFGRTGPSADAPGSDA